MRIGIACTLKPDGPPPPGAGDDWAEEFDSPATVEAVAGVLRDLGHEVRTLGDGRAFLEAVLADPPDLVFNFAEGTGVSRSREARVPAVCEMLGIPVTGSDPLALAVALDKDMTRRIVEAAGLTVPKGFTIAPPPADYDGDHAEFPALLDAAGLTCPVIVKPALEGSSKGIRRTALVRTVAEFGPAVTALWKEYRQPALVEEFIVGDEVTVGMTGNDPPQPLGVMRVVPTTPTEEFVYSLEVKRAWDGVVSYEAPAKLPKAVYAAVEADALTAFAALGCRDVARADFRVRDGVPYFLEINPLPGLNPDSGDLCYLAYRMGRAYPELIRLIFDAAATRCGL